MSRKHTHAGHCFYDYKDPLQATYEFHLSISRSIFDPTYPVNPSSIGEHIRKIRMDAGLQIKQLAQISGLSEMTIINWEKGKARPNNLKLELLKKVLEERGFYLPEIN